MKTTVTTLLLACIVAGCVVPVAAAQPVNSTSTPTTTTASSDTAYRTVLAGDPSTKIVNATWRDGGVELVVESDTFGTLTLISPPAERSAGSSVGTVERVQLTDGRVRVRIDAPTGRVWLATRTSFQNGKFTVLDRGGDGTLIGGPWTRGDAAFAAIGGAAAVAVMGLYRAAQAKIGVVTGGERLA